MVPGRCLSSGCLDPQAQGTVKVILRNYGLLAMPFSSNVTCNHTGHEYCVGPKSLADPKDLDPM